MDGTLAGRSAAGSPAEAGEISAALEDYLEIILELSSRTPAVRVRDIAKAKAVRMPTVTWALRSLAARKLVVYRAREYVALTPAGAAIAQRVTGRHVLLERFLAGILQVPPETAANDACRLEHHLSGVTLERLSAFVEYVQTSPGVGEGFLERFRSHCGKAAAAAPADLTPLSRAPEGASVRIGRLLAGRGARIEWLRQGLVPGALVEIVRAGGARRATTIRLQGREMVLTPKQAEGIHVQRGEDA